MKYILTVKPNAKTTAIERISKTNFRISVKSSPHDGKANKELIQTLAKFLHVPQSAITIEQGASAQKKTIEIL